MRAFLLFYLLNSKTSYIFALRKIFIVKVLVIECGIVGGLSPHSCFYTLS